MKKNYIMWAIALVLVNSGWYFVSQQSASQEINRPGADFSENREAELTSIVGDQSRFELEFCFKSNNGEVYDVSIEIKKNSESIYFWNGTTDDDCITHSDTVEEGEITVITLADESVEVTANLVSWPMENALIPGVILFSIGTVVVAYGERIVRKIIVKRLDRAAAESSVEIHSNPTVETSGIWQEPVRPK